jgi:transcriptional regulator with XRE-family HTH domain
VAERRNPTVRRRELGALLRRLRLQAGATVDQVAGQLLCSPSKVSRMETGQRGASQRDVRDLCDLYHVTDPQERDHLFGLAREGKRQAWWQTLDWPEPLSTYVALEAEAASISTFESDVVPGLLQTADYARALTRVVVPPLDETAIEKYVSNRLRRQEILAQENPLQLHAVIDEAALRRLPGGKEIKLGQLARIIECARQPNVTIQVFPFTAGPQPGSDSTFAILDYATPVLTSTVYVESLAGNLYLEREVELATYRRVFSRLCELALSQHDTVSFLQAMMETIAVTNPPVQGNPVDYTLVTERTLA